MLYLKCRLLFSVQTALISVTLIGNVLPRYVVDKYVMTKAHMTMAPWVGVLRYKQYEKEAVTGIILISSKLAIANAKDVKKINKKTIRDTAKAMFLSPNNQAWYCAVINYTLHPEFNEDTLNTLALLNLEYEDDDFKADMLDWPSDLTSYSFSNVFAVGFIERNQILDQVVYRMEYVNFTDCIDFYINEQLDTKWMRPTHYTCYRGMFDKGPCVYKNGMALAVNISGTWTLLGMSTWGPGCALPARFINFASFIPWVNSKTRTRRGKDDEPFHMEKDDTIYSMEKTSENTVVLRPVLDYLTESHGDCGGKHTKNEYLMYHEEAKYQVPRFGVGIYTFSHYDHHFEWQWNCIMITAGSNIYYKSQANIWSSKGFGKGLADEQRLKNFIKIYPIKSQLPGETTQGPKKLYLTDTWENYKYIDIRNLHFRFDFYQEGTIKIMFYSSRIFKDITRAYKTRSYKAEDATYKRKSHAKDLYTLYTTPPRPTLWTGTVDKNKQYGLDPSR